MISMTAPSAEQLAAVVALELFQDAPRARVAEVLARGSVVDCPAGELLMRAGDLNRHVAFVLDGALDIHLGKLGSVERIVVGPGESVGEMSVVDGQPVSAHVIAGSDCRLLLIDAELFLGDVLALPGVARRVISWMSARLRQSNDEVIERVRVGAELERMQRELDFARMIQTGMLAQRVPLFPDHPEVECAARMRAAREVGGDLYEAFPIDRRHVFVAVGDACGKGMPAAMFMMRTLTLLRGEATRHTGDPLSGASEIAERINDGLSGHNEANLFVTLFLALLDVETGLLTYVSAGHNPPLLAAPGGRFGELAVPINMAAGAFPGMRYRAAQHLLAPGSCLVCYTDGVTESFDPAGELFGEERFAGLLDGTGDRRPEPLIERTFGAVDAFAAGREQADDITMLALRYRGAAG